MPRKKSSTAASKSAWKPNADCTVDYKFTDYFEKKVLLKRPYLTKEMCIRVVEAPEQKEMQADGDRVSYWARVPDLEGRALRVVTLSDGITIHNAFPDRRFKS